MGSAVIMSMYLIGVLIALISALILRKTLLKGESEFIMELPPYMLPNPKELWIMTWSRTKHFIQKAGTVILAMSVVVWYITTYPGGSIEESYAAMLGKAIQPIFSPMGWSWELVLALISGFVAKEVVVATIGVLNIDIQNVMTPHQAFAYMLFTLLYMPCIATIAAIRAEIGTRWAAFAVIFSFSVAYVIALIATGVGLWL
jgi:ferrous iron transport protein B